MPNKIGEMTIGSKILILCLMTLWVIPAGSVFSASAPMYYVQIGALKEMQSALDLNSEVAQSGFSAVLKEWQGHPSWIKYKVMLGPFAHWIEAQRMRRKLQAAMPERHDAFIFKTALPIVAAEERVEGQAAPNTEERLVSSGIISERNDSKKPVAPSRSIPAGGNRQAPVRLAASGFKAAAVARAVFEADRVTTANPGPTDENTSPSGPFSIALSHVYRKYHNKLNKRLEMNRTGNVLAVTSVATRPLSNQNFDTSINIDSLRISYDLFDRLTVFVEVGGASKSMDEFGFVHAEGLRIRLLESTFQNGIQMLRRYRADSAMVK